MDRTITLKSGATVKKPYSKAPLYIGLVILALYISYQLIDPNLSLLIKNISNAGEIITQLFSFDLEDIKGLSKYQYEFSSTITMAVCASIMGMLFAYPVGIFCAMNINNNKFSWFVRMFLNVWRTIPILVIGGILQIFFGASDIAGLITLTIFTFLISTKMIYEHIETLNLDSYKGALAIGMTRFAAIRYTLMPQIKSYILSTSLYMFDTNLRTSAIIGIVCGAGIGKELNDKLAVPSTRPTAGLIIIFLVVLVYGFDVLFRVVRKRLER